jgi:hypothetical protein
MSSKRILKTQIFIWCLRNLTKTDLCNLDLTRPRLVYVLLLCKFRPAGFVIGPLPQKIHCYIQATLNFLHTDNSELIFKKHFSRI